MIPFKRIYPFHTCIIFVLLLLISCDLFAQEKRTATIRRFGAKDIEQVFKHPPASAKPWVFWYWMNAAVSKAGITADLEAMKDVGIGGAYLMPIKDTTSLPLMIPPVRQLSAEWWEMVRFAMQEAKRLDLQLGIHLSDGFALAGGPWITPEHSMQKLTWSKQFEKGGRKIEQSLEKPDTNEGFYKDIAVYAYPAVSTTGFNEVTLVPTVSTSNGVKAQFLCYENEEKQSFKSDSACWIQYKYPVPFTCRSLVIHTGGNNYQAERLLVQASDDGKNFRDLMRLDPPRHGWQDNDADITYSIPSTTAKYFRFVYDKEGSEPGSEDLDAAKWKPVLKVQGIYLSDEPQLHQYESKNGMVWRVSRKTTAEQVPENLCVPLSGIINLTNKMDASGKLSWDAPAGNWVILRMGHTSTGHRNETAGAGKGLECDKFDPAAVKMEFDNWFGKAFEKTDPALAREVLKVFHVDSWECGSQNWTANFPAEFKKRRGYDLLPYLPAMAGVPLESAEISEAFLHDVRQTIAELINDKFYATLNKLAHEKGCSFSAESVAPTMVSDGMMHYQNADMPMGEFWLNSPTHDKPNDMLDAISGAHIYGKNIVQAEAFTSVRMNWGEYPGMLKTLGDRQFAAGINKMVLHVFVHNPWLDRKPGMTLDGVGLYFQRDQTWFKQSKAWIAYLQRCQALLQLGKPVTDIAVFAGEETPRRAVLPDRLVSTLPGIFGEERVSSERKRLKNDGTPLRQKPDGVTHSANMADPENWIDPLHGYAYDCFNPDVLMKATVKDGRVFFPGGANYKLLVFPVSNPLSPEKKYMTYAVQQKIIQLIKAGANVIMGESPEYSPSLKDRIDKHADILLLSPFNKKTGSLLGKGKLKYGPYYDSSFLMFGIEKDLIALENGKSANDIAWTHRRGDDFDIYFISNQQDKARYIDVSLRMIDRQPTLCDAVSGDLQKNVSWESNGKRTRIYYKLPANGSLFIVAEKVTGKTYYRDPSLTIQFDKAYDQLRINKGWRINFDKNGANNPFEIVADSLFDWSRSSDRDIKYFSGTAVYTNSFNWDKELPKEKVELNIGEVNNIATVKVNGIDCGTLWTAPFVLDISKAVKKGNNKIEIAVTNTWHNRLIGDHLLPEKERITNTTAPFRLEGKPLLKAGLVGPVYIEY